MGEINNFLLEYYRLDIKTLISSVKLQDTKSVYKNQLCFYTLTMKYLKRKLKGNCICNHIQKNEILGNKLKKCKTCSLKTINIVML